jgi:hypothetical protein
MKLINHSTPVDNGQQPFHDRQREPATIRLPSTRSVTFRTPVNEASNQFTHANER